MKKPIIITINGIDGSGKGTHSKKLKEYLEKFGSVLFQDFPTYTTPAGKLLGKYLDGKLENTYNKPTFLASIYAMDRLEWWESIKDKDGYDFILFDRFTYSALAFQSSFAGNEENEMFNFIKDTEFNFMGLPKSDLVIWLDISPELAQKNILQKSKREYTEQKQDLHEKNINILIGARQGYFNLMQKMPDVVKRVKVDNEIKMNSFEENFKKIKDLVSKLQNKHLVSV